MSEILIDGFNSITDSVNVPTVPVVYDDESSAAGGLTMEMNSYIQDH
jgi:hypothetical protein